jgi:hypothetical protein
MSVVPKQIGAEACRRSGVYGHPRSSPTWVLSVCDASLMSQSWFRLMLVGGPAQADDPALSLVVSALAPLAIQRCSGRPDLIDDLLTEMVLVGRTIKLNELFRSRRRHASVARCGSCGGTARPARRRCRWRL